MMHGQKNIEFKGYWQLYL